MFAQGQVAGVLRIQTLLGWPCLGCAHRDVQESIISRHVQRVSWVKCVSARCWLDSTQLDKLATFLSSVFCLLLSRQARSIFTTAV